MLTYDRTKCIHMFTQGELLKQDAMHIQDTNRLLGERAELFRKAALMTAKIDDHDKARIEINTELTRRNKP